MDIPVTENRGMNCHSPCSGKLLQDDVREIGELEHLKFELNNVKTLLAVIFDALGEDPMLRSRINKLARKGVPPFINLLESTT